MRAGKTTKLSRGKDHVGFVLNSRSITICLQVPRKFLPDNADNRELTLILFQNAFRRKDDSLRFHVARRNGFSLPYRSKNARNIQIGAADCTLSHIFYVSHHLLCGSKVRERVFAYLPLAQACGNVNFCF